MMQAAQFATVRKFNQLSGNKRFSAGPELYSLFEFAADDGFYQIGRFDYDRPEFDMCRELNALPLE
jgi:hypothetical protein